MNANDLFTQLKGLVSDFEKFKNDPSYSGPLSEVTIEAIEQKPKEEDKKEDSKEESALFKQPALKVDEAIIPKGEYQSPVKGDWNSSGGYAGNMVRPNGRVGHQGVDLRAPGGTPIYPLTSGIVTNVGNDKLGGNIVNITHADGVKSYYAHLGTIKVQKGDKVDNSTIIGTLGNTGNAKNTYPHLHFQAWVNGQITDPAKFFSVPKYTNLTDEEKSKVWLTKKDQDEAIAFSVRDHVESHNKMVADNKKPQQNNRVANKYNYLVKVAESFERLSKKI